MQRMRKICVAGLFLVVLGLGGCAEIADENGKAGSSVSEDERFEAYTREVFCSEVSANAVSLHYTLKYPQEYGIESAPAVYGTVVTDEQAVKAGVENMEKALITFEKNKLSVENQITYDVLQSYLDSAERSAEYLWYDEPLGTVSGVQTQLPVVLSEYRFYEKEDADTSAADSFASSTFAPSTPSMAVMSSSICLRVSSSNCTIDSFVPTD